MAENIGDRVKRARLAMGMPAKELTELAGLSSGYLTQLEQGKYKDIGAVRLQRIANALGVSERYLLWGDESQEPDRHSLAPGWLSGAMEDPELREDTKRLIRRAAEQDYRDSHER